MKLLIFGGSGKMGRVVAWDLVRESDVEAVGLADRSETGLELAEEWIKSPKITTHVLNVLDQKAVQNAIQGYDIIVSTLPTRRTSYKLFEAAIEAGVNMVDILEEYHRRPDPYETEGLEIPEGLDLSEYGEQLHERAAAKGITILDGIGFAPGISNITLGEGIRKLDQVDRAIARVGGIPNKEAARKHPLGYTITWSFGHVLREYMISVQVIKGGEVVEVNALTERDRFTFNQFGVCEELECAITPGMPSFLYTRPNLQEFAEKTIRWPGHYDGIETFKESGMLDLDPVTIDGVEIRPRDFLLQVIQPRLQPREGDTDVCVMWNTVEGVRDGKQVRINYYMWDEADTTNKISSMGRVTGYSAAIGATFLGRGLIDVVGIVPPEDCIQGPLYDPFIQACQKRGIEILELIEEVE